MAVAHYEILRNTANLLVVKVNPKAYTASIFRGKPSDDAVISINANYFGTIKLTKIHYPIGILQDQGKVIYSLSKYNDVRPVLNIGNTVALLKGTALEGATAVQAGPTLLYGGHPYYDAGESFRADAVRREDHPAIGLLPNGKLLLVWAKNASMDELRRIFTNLGAHSAMKMDGGGSCHLRIKTEFGEIVRGNPTAVVGLQFS